MRKTGRTFLLFVLVAISIVCAIYLNTSDREAFLETQEVNEKPIFSVDTDKKVVSLTFDVNWAEKEYLYDILDVLEKNDVKATFFIMGKWVIYPDGNREKLVKIKEGGHEIGNHSYVHPEFDKISEGRMLEEARKTDEIIEEVVGVKPKLFRFPSGAYNKKSYEMMKSLGYECIQWNADSVDWKQSGEQVEYDKVMKKIKPGSIVLFHNNAIHTPKNLEKIIVELRSQGYTFLPVGEMMYDEGYLIDSDGVQRKN
ncbi:MAG: polysaccharide deacetylase family protein [Clostridium sp.]